MKVEFWQVPFRGQETLIVVVVENVEWILMNISTRAIQMIKVEGSYRDSSIFKHRISTLPNNALITASGDVLKGGYGNSNCIVVARELMESIQKYAWMLMCPLSMRPHPQGGAAAVLIPREIGEIER